MLRYPWHDTVEHTLVRRGGRKHRRSRLRGQRIIGCLCAGPLRVH